MVYLMTKKFLVHFSFSFSYFFDTNAYVLLIFTFFETFIFKEIDKPTEVRIFQQLIVLRETTIFPLINVEGI